jgi:mono/diheme cytochrome c family protein
MTRARIPSAAAIALAAIAITIAMTPTLAGRASAQQPAAGQPPPAAPAGDAGRGKTLFVNNGCYQCHNYEGQGGAAGARIAPPPPFRGFAAYVRAPRGDMPPYTVKVMSEQDLADVYAYLRSRPRPPAVSTLSLLAR